MPSLAACIRRNGLRGSWEPLSIFNEGSSAFAAAKRRSAPEGAWRRSDGVAGGHVVRPCRRPRRPASASGALPPGAALGCGAERDTRNPPAPPETSRPQPSRSARLQRGASGFVARGAWRRVPAGIRRPGAQVRVRSPCRQLARIDTRAPTAGEAKPRSANGPVDAAADAPRATALWWRARRFTAAISARQSGRTFECRSWLLRPAGARPASGVSGGRGQRSAGRAAPA